MTAAVEAPPGVAADVAEARRAFPAHVGWATGTVGSSLILNLQGTMFLFFLSRVLGIPVATAGALLLVAKVYDIFVNPMVGALSDRTSGQWGRRRPFLLAGALVAGPAIAIFFSISPDWGSPLFIALLGLMAIATGYTLFNVPFLAIPGEIGLSYHGRTRLMSFRNVASVIGVFFGMVLAPVLLGAVSNPAGGYQLVGFASGAIISVTMLIAFVATGRLRFDSHTPERPTKGAYREVLTSRGFRTLLAAKFMTLVSTALGQGALLFMITDVLNQSPRMLAAYGIAAIVSNLCSLPFWNWLSRRVDKRRTLMLAFSGVALGHLSWLLATPGEPVIGYIARGLFIGVFVAGGLVIVYSMLPDVMTLYRRQTGQRREGAFAGIYSMSEKIAFAAAPALLAFLLGSSGRGTDLNDQTIRLTLACGPAIGYVLAMGAAWFYPITEAMLGDKDERPTD